MIIIATNQITGEQIEFPLMKKAAEHAGIRRTSMSYRVKTGITDKFGWVYAEKELTKEEMTKRQNQYLKQKMYASKKTSEKQEQISKRRKEKFDNKRFHISYAKNSFGVCITPCPFIDSPKPMIGSHKCQKCPHFEMIDRHAQQVACKKGMSL